MTARTLMFQGTGSNVGKSIIVAGLCRVASNRGIRVAPFKPQNMSNNAAACDDGSEIGRAQALQASASRLAPSHLFNPVLIKPQTDTTAQIIVHGVPFATSDAAEYMNRTRESLLPQVMESYRALREQHDLVLVEGAGSPAETNLRQGDIANMGFAVPADIPVCLIADIDRGGVIASIVGTNEVLSMQDRSQIRSFIVNRFRGDIRLFDGGISDICHRTGWWCAGVVPWLPEVARLPQEDAVPLDDEPGDNLGQTRPEARLKISVPMLSRIANFDDMDPLRQESDVALQFITPGRPIPLDTDVVIIPGTKSAMTDINFIRAQGWDSDIIALARAGKQVMGLCGGYQILGNHIVDRTGSDGVKGQTNGLGLLGVETEMRSRKTVARRQGVHCGTGEPLTGYEIHVGTTQGHDGNRPFANLGQQNDGAGNEAGNVWGTYLHGVFNNDQFRRAWLEAIKAGSGSSLAFDRSIDTALDQLAGSLEAAIDVEQLFATAT